MLFTSQRELVPILLTGVQKPKRENDHSSSLVKGSTLLTLVKRLKRLKRALTTRLTSLFFFHGRKKWNFEKRRKNDGEHFFEFNMIKNLFLLFAGENVSAL